jgi:menaquinone-dependent protoporphyrinogen oxidase
MVAVAGASRHGATREIAQRIADRLTSMLPQGWDVRVCEPTDLEALNEADAVVLGSAIYFGRWMKSARRARAYLEAAAVPAVWLFSSGPVSEHGDENRSVIAADKAAPAGETLGHAVFGGRIHRPSLGWLERVIVRAVKAVDVDARDWQAIDDWASSIAMNLMNLGTQGLQPIPSKKEIS